MSDDKLMRQILETAMLAGGRSADPEMHPFLKLLLEKVDPWPSADGAGGSQ